MIVSRNVRSLDEAHLNSAAIESLAENLNDSVVAPSTSSSSASPEPCSTAR